MTPKQKSDLMFNTLSGMARRRAEQINHCRHVESKPVECQGGYCIDGDDVKNVITDDEPLYLCRTCRQEWQKVQHENARINARDAELEERRMR